MDSGSVTASGRLKNKPSKRPKSSEGEDIISNLPDFIIGRILSFLPTKDAVRTSVLSKRWEYLWTFITELNCDDSVLYSSKRTRKKCFLNFVYRVLLHLNNSSIQSFSLALSEKYDPSHVNEWLSAVLNRKVKKLCVDSEQNLALSFHSLFKCQSLVELVLKMDCCSAIRVPTFVNLPYLTILKLSGITFTCDSSNNSEKLNLNFPVLRKYETNNCTWLSLKSVTLEVPLLEVVSIEFRPASLSPESHTAIKFCASRLAEFTYRGYISQDIILLDLSTAHIASANIIPCNFKEERVQETGILGFKLLKQFNKVECLKFQPSEVLAQAKDSLVDLPTFGMLSRLELGLCTAEILLGLLLKSPSLKTLVFKGLFKFEKELLNSAVVPDCFLSTLQVVKFGTLNGYDHELSFAKFVMENALVLERMSFAPGWKLRSSDTAMEVVKEKLFSFKKGFSFAIVEFSS